MAEAPDQLKQRIRREVREQRAGRSSAEQLRARSTLTQHLAALVTEVGARSVSCYLPIAGEPDTSEFVAWAQTHGIEVLLPSAREDGELHWARASDAGTAPGAFGIPEPLGERLDPTAVSDVDLMLIPACAVDRSGVRLGWGRGYFDRSLGAMRPRPPVFAVLYEAELRDTLPREPHDVPVAGVVTPAGVVHFDQADSRD